MKEKLQCPFCQSFRTRRLGVGRFRCKRCEKVFSFTASIKENIQANKHALKEELNQRKPILVE